MLDGNTKMPWGKHKGKRIYDIPYGYWEWALRQSWFGYKGDLVEYAKARCPHAEVSKTPEQRKKPEYVPSKVIHPEIPAPWE